MTSLSPLIAPTVVEFRQGFLRDHDRSLAGLQEALESFSARPLESLYAVLDSFLAIKANFESAEFPHCAEIVRRLEREVSDIESILSGASDEDPRWRSLSGCLRDAHLAIAGFFADLSLELIDDVPVAARAEWVVESLRAWREHEQPPVAAALIKPPASETRIEVTAESRVVAEVEAPAEVAPDPAPAVSDVASASSDRRFRSYLLFANGTRDYAVEIGHVREIVESQTFYSLPLPREEVVGVMNLRGEPLSILSLNHAFRGTAPGAKPYVVVAHVGRTQFGFQAERMYQVVSLDTTTFQDAGPVLGDENSHLIQHLCLAEGKRLLVLDMSKAVL